MRDRQEVAGRLQTPSAGGTTLPKASVQVSADTPAHLLSCTAFEGFPKGYGSDFGGGMTDLGENDHLGEAALSPPAGRTVARSWNGSWSESESSGLDLGAVDGFKGC